MISAFICHFPRRRASIVGLLLLAWFIGGVRVHANPTGGTAPPGTATITLNPSGSQLTVNQTSANAFITWNSFNIAAGETTTFNQPSASSVAWNQINDANPSQILGNLNANGYVVLQNPNGFYIGGQAAITTHGLVMTTASTLALNLSSGGPWSFNAPPPSAQIANYGKINITGGGTAFLIAGNILNGGMISAPGGKIGLYDGQTVLVSTSPDGRGLSAAVTLPQGSVDNEGHLIADGGSIAALARTVNQNGVVQANSAQNVNGTIELVASDSLKLGANSVISAQGDSTVTTPSSGGSVQLQSGNSFSDQAGSAINVSGGPQGGYGGQIAISAPQMSALNTTLNGQAAVGYAGGSLSINTADIAFNSDGIPVPDALALNANSFAAGFSQIHLQAAGSIEVGAPLSLAFASGIIDTVSLLAGNTITVDSGTKIEADAGIITLKANTVNQNGNLQANSMGNANGVIEVDAADSLTLGVNSVISANGDSSAASASPGGFVVLNAGNNTFDGKAGSKISVSGAAGGPDGIVEIFGGNIVDATSIKSTIDGLSAAAFSLNHLLINLNYLTLSTSATDPITDLNSDPNSANINIADLAGYSQIDLQALDNIELNTLWYLADPGTAAAARLSAGNDITFDDGGIYSENGILAGKNWSVSLTAGTGFVPTAQQPSPPSGSDGIYLDSGSYLQTQDGNINLWAANEVQVGWSGAGYGSQVNSGAGSVTTKNGGNITVTTRYGDVNTGSDTAGFDYHNQVPYYTVDWSLGGISTAAGGNVTISAGGNVISYLPSGNSSVAAGDAGTGAFGPAPGNVTITAGGSVYGHYVLADGVGTITAGQNAGAAAGNPFALSLIDGSWSVNAPNGNIYLQEVRDPNGVFNNVSGKGGLGKHLFGYGSDASVDLTAGKGVYLTSLNVPRPSGAVPVLYPPILDITAGSGGVTLEGNVTLFPSPDQNLTITTTAGGDFTSTGSPSSPYELLMSDSALTQWSGLGNFGDNDHGTLANEPTDTDPVIINISGSMENLNLITTKATEITVGGNMINCGFSGQNLSASDVTSINVAGQIENSSAYFFVTLSQAIPDISVTDLLPGMGNSWDDIFTLAVNPTEIAALTVLPGTPIAQLASYALTHAGVFSVTFDQGIHQLVGVNPGFLYDPATGQFGFGGNMSATVLSELTQPVTILQLVNGVPATYTGANGQTYFKTTTISWVAPSIIQSLYAASQSDLSPTSGQLGYRIGGPGEFDINAGSISLGNSYGILSCGVYDSQGGFNRYNNLASITPAGATVNVTVSDDLSMLTSTIATLGGGDVNITSTGGSMDLGSQALYNTQRQVGFGVFTAGGGDANVTALDDINISGSRIATYDGGDIFVKSLIGSVNVGSGGNTYIGVLDSFVNPDTGLAAFYPETAYGSGIVAYTLVPPQEGQTLPPNPAKLPGNITVLAPQGDIISTKGGILQEALNGTITAGPTVTLEAGTPAGGDWNSKEPPLYTGNIDLGNSGVIGGMVNLKATGNIAGQVISRQDSTVNAGQSFSGTLLSGGSATLNAGGGVSGTIIGVGSVTVSGGNITASVLSQNANVGGKQSDTLGSSANATASSQSAAQQANTQSQKQVASNDTNPDDEKNKKKKPGLRKVSRVTVILSAATPPL